MRSPRYRDAALFRTKASLLQIKRAFGNAFESDLERWSVADSLSHRPILAESRTPLWTSDKDSEIPFVAGKIHNLRLAIPRLNGVEVDANRVLSFWKQVGRASRLKGYTRGRELREGCLIASVGGGICQLSNALYEAAVKAGLEIVERHPHTKIIPGSLAEKGLDATVFWNYVDLRMKSAHAFRVEAFLTAESLVVRIRGERDRSRVELHHRRITADIIENCSACERTNCFRHSQPRRTQFGRAAYLVDEFWPEFDRYISSTRRESDLICLPIDGRRFRKSNYSWTTDGFSDVKQVPSFVLYRSYQLRRLASQGAARQQALLTFNERLARHFASFLTYETTHLVITQNLLPFLWLGGHLGGRTVDVLMTRLPLAVLHRTLDEAYKLHPESKTLTDFRADNLLVDAETEALVHARKIITPHSMVAATFPHKAELIPWHTTAGTPAQSNTSELRLIFPASTVARKGAYELRAALQGSDAQLTILGPVLEDENFWRGVRIEKASKTENCFARASAVVLPAFVEHRPVRLLEAIAGGIPVIASTACGLENMKGITGVKAGDVESLRTAINRLQAA